MSGIRVNGLKMIQNCMTSFKEEPNIHVCTSRKFQVNEVEDDYILIIFFVYSTDFGK